MPINVVNTDGIGKLVIGNAAIARLLAPERRDFVRIRLGVRCKISDTGASLVGPPRIYLGLHSNPNSPFTNSVLSSACTHFVGVTTTTADPQWLRLTGPPAYYYVNNAGGIPDRNFRAVKKVGATETRVAMNSMSSLYTCMPTTTSVMLVVDLTRGASSWTLVFAGIANASNTLTQLKTVMGISDLSLAMGRAVLTQSISASEATNGELNAVCLAWDRLDSWLTVEEFLYSIFPS